MTDPSPSQILAGLSTPAASDPVTLTRRRFLQAAAATAGASALLPSWLADLAAAATPLGPSEGVLVVVLLGGGNDGLNTVVPTDDPTYYARRGGVAIAAQDALPLRPGVGLHPALTWLKSSFDAGQVAVLRGVGDVKPDLSHFSAMARWMSGTGHDVAPTGWLGRYLDGLPGGDDPFHAVTVGSSVPLVLQGAARRATAVPTKVEGVIDPEHEHEWVRRASECVRAMGAGPTGLGQWGDAIAAAGRTAVDLTGRMRPLYEPKLGEGRLARQLELCARLINADLGVRVLHTQVGSFDHHANQGWQHAARLGDLDAGLSRFFSTLDRRFARRTTVVTVSEFGRRLQANRSGGTDHGTASTLFAVGAGVRGGLYGEQPSLSALDRAGNLATTVDFRSVYATLLESWLGADARQILQGRFENLGFLRRPSA